MANRQIDLEKVYDTVTNNIIGSNHIKKYYIIYNSNKFVLTFYLNVYRLFEVEKKIFAKWKLLFKNKSLDELRKTIIIDNLTLDQLIECENTVLFRDGREEWRFELFGDIGITGRRYRSKNKNPLDKVTNYPEYLELNKKVFETRKEKGLEKSNESIINAADSFAKTWNNLMAPYIIFNVVAFMIYSYITIFQTPQTLPTICWVIFYFISILKFVVYFLINKKIKLPFTNGKSFALFAKVNLLLMGLNFFLDFFFLLTVPFGLFILFFMINIFAILLGYFFRRNFK